MRFSDYLHLTESGSIQWGFMGELTAELGGDQSERLNYGTGGSFKKFGSFLYVKIDTSKGPYAAIAKAAKRFVSRVGIECLKSKMSSPGSNKGTWDDDMTVTGGVNFYQLGNWQCKMSSPARSHKTDFRDTGEFHVTISQQPEIYKAFESRHGTKPTGTEEVIAFLKEATTSSGDPLFSGDLGMKMPIIPKKEITFGFAPSFLWSKPGGGSSSPPIVALLEVSCPRGNEVRASLGMSRWPEDYTPHTTVALAYTVQSALDDGREVVTTNTAKAKLAQTTKSAHDAGYNQVKGSTLQAVKQEARMYERYARMIPGFEPIGTLYLN